MPVIIDDVLHAQIEKHRSLAIQLKEIKDAEMKLRLEICDKLLKGKGVGTHTYKTDDLVAKAVKKVNYAVNKDLLADIYDDMDEAERACFKFEPKLLKKMFDQVDSELVNSVVIVEEVTPSLTVAFRG